MTPPCLGRNVPSNVIGWNVQLVVCLLAEPLDRVRPRSPSFLSVNTDLGPLWTSVGLQLSEGLQDREDGTGTPLSHSTQTRTHIRTHAHTHKHTHRQTPSFLCCRLYDNGSIDRRGPLILSLTLIAKQRGCVVRNNKSQSLCRSSSLPMYRGKLAASLTNMSFTFSSVAPL